MICFGEYWFNSFNFPTHPFEGWSQRTKIYVLDVLRRRPVSSCRQCQCSTFSFLLWLNNIVEGKKMCSLVGRERIELDKETFGLFIMLSVKIFGVFGLSLGFLDLLIKIQ